MRRMTRDVQSLMATKTPTSVDAAFFAGFYEGEGSCTRLKRNPGPIVTVAQKDPEMLYRMRDFWGGSVRETRNFNKPSRQLEGRDSWMNPFFKWCIAGNRARLFLQAIYPYLSSRRKSQIDKTDWSTLSSAKTRVSGGMSPDRAVLRIGMTAKQLRAEEKRHYRANNREEFNARQRAYRARLKENLDVKESIQ